MLASLPSIALSALLLGAAPPPPELPPEPPPKPVVRELTPREVAPVEVGEPSPWDDDGAHVPSPRAGRFVVLRGRARLGPAPDAPAWITLPGAGGRHGAGAEPFFVARLREERGGWLRVASVARDDGAWPHCGLPWAPDLALELWVRRSDALTVATARAVTRAPSGTMVELAAGTPVELGPLGGRVALANPGLAARVDVAPPRGLAYSPAGLGPPRDDLVAGDVPDGATVDALGIVALSEVWAIRDSGLRVEGLFPRKRGGDPATGPGGASLRSACARVVVVWDDVVARDAAPSFTPIDVLPESLPPERDRVWIRAGAALTDADGAVVGRAVDARGMEVTSRTRARVCFRAPLLDRAVGRELGAEDAAVVVCASARDRDDPPVGGVVGPPPATRP